MTVFVIPKLWFVRKRINSRIVCHSDNCAWWTHTVALWPCVVPRAIRLTWVLFQFHSVSIRKSMSSKTRYCHGAGRLIKNGSSDFDIWRRLTAIRFMTEWQETYFLTRSKFLKHFFGDKIAEVSDSTCVCWRRADTVSELLNKIP
jgi:hypothetical protein